ncbi:allantoin permease, partial [Shigella sonnei]
MSLMSPFCLIISLLAKAGNDSNLLIVFYVQIMPD